MWKPDAMASEASSADSSGGFPTTAWSFIRIAQDPAHADFVQAMNRFIARYWKPVFYFLRGRGYPLHRAEDLTQEFFLRFVERPRLEMADPERGRFRTFLLTLLVRFLSDQGPKRAPRQIAFEQQFVSVGSLMGDDERSFEPPTDATPETIFMRQWAATLVADVLQQLCEFYANEGRPDWFKMFTAVHFDEGTGERPSQQELAERFGLSRDQVRYGLELVQKRFTHVLRSEVHDQVDAEADVG